MRPPDPVTGGAARQAARAELRHAEYHRDDPGLLDRAVHWFGRRLGEVFSGSAGGNAVLVFAVLLAVVVIVLVVRAGPPGRAAATRSADDPLATLPAADHRQLAADHEAAGRWADALREWLRAVVGTIEERGILDPRPGRTGAATAREAGPLLPSLAADLAAAMATFDAVWFGGRPAQPQDVAAAHRLADAVRRTAVDRGRAAPAGGVLTVPPR